MLIGIKSTLNSRDLDARVRVCEKRRGRRLWQILVGAHKVECMPCSAPGNHCKRYQRNLVHRSTEEIIKIFVVKEAKKRCDRRWRRLEGAWRRGKLSERRQLAVVKSCLRTRPKKINRQLQCKILQFRLNQRRRMWGGSRPRSTGRRQNRITIVVRCVQYLTDQMHLPQAVYLSMIAEISAYNDKM